MPLPAPYAPPWKRLGEDGVALVAWLGLKLREGFRRNREGTLPVPPFWPRRWRQLFWPLALVAVALVGLALGRLWLAPPSSSPRSRVEAPPGLGSPAPSGRSSEVGEGLGPASGTQVAQGAPAGAGVKGELPREPLGQGEGDGVPVTADRGDDERNGTPNALHPPEPPSPTATTEPTEPADPIEAIEATEAIEPADIPESQAATFSEADRLLAQWRADDPKAPIDAIHAAAASATLTLELNGRFLNQSPAQRQRQAERWLERAAGLGYSHLRLVDGQRRLLGRDAWVGGGILLLRPPDPELTPQ
jgi:hypothetical protein